MTGAVGDKVFRVAVVPAQMPAHVRPVGRARAPVAAAARARIPGLQRNPERPARQVEDGRPLAFVFHCFGGYIHWQPCQTAAGRRGFSGRNTMSSKAPRFVPSIRLARYDVINKKGEDLGQVQTFVVDMSEGIIAFALVAFGGFLGISDKWFAIPWEALKWHPTTNKFVLSMSEKVLKEAPGMDERRPTLSESQQRCFVVVARVPSSQAAIGHSKTHFSEPASHAGSPAQSDSWSSVLQSRLRACCLQ